jgi:outer membrane protein OmpA-like peptidoglycan-associated protein
MRGADVARALGSRLVWLAAVVVVVAAAPACARFAAEPLQRPGQDLVVLLPDSDAGTTSRASVSNTAGMIELAGARAATRVAPNQPPSAVTVLSEADVQSLFGDALASLPPETRAFTLYFEFESEELTPASRSLLQETLETVKSRPVPDVLVVGHTDTTGAPTSNFELGLRRANVVRALLVGAGLDANAVATTSHGEAQPLVQTADEVYEPRNRRVHVTVR